MRKKILCTLLLIPIVVSMAIANVSAPPPTYLYMDPPVTWCPTCTEFTVDITVSVITRPQMLWAYQIELTFDPNVVHGVSYENGDFMESRGGNAVFIPGMGFDNEAGTLYLFGAYLDPIARFPYGYEGLLASVTFHIVGEGSSDLAFGEATGLVDATGRFIPCGVEDGLVISKPGPELYVRRRGAHGGGVWPEWHVGAVCSDQTLYARVMNYGEMGADVEVVFEVIRAGMETQYYTSNQAPIDAATWVEDDIVPGEVIVSATFHVGDPGLYEVNAKLYFKADVMEEKIFYGSEGLCLDGEPVSRDVATKYKAATS